MVFMLHTDILDPSIGMTLCVRVSEWVSECVCVCERERERERDSPNRSLQVPHITQIYLTHTSHRSIGCVHKQVCSSMKTCTTGWQNQFQTCLTWSQFHNPTVGSSCLLSLLARDLCQLVIGRAEVVLKETIPTT